MFPQIVFTNLARRRRRKKSRFLKRFPLSNARKVPIFFAPAAGKFFHKFMCIMFPQIVSRTFPSRIKLSTNSKIRCFYKFFHKLLRGGKLPLIPWYVHTRKIQAGIFYWRSSFCAVQQWPTFHTYKKYSTGAYTSVKSACSQV